MNYVGGTERIVQFYLYESEQRTFERPVKPFERAPILSRDRLDEVIKVLINHSHTMPQNPDRPSSPGRVRSG
ncbi:MAG: hypothetical protein WBB85_14230 [Albidovulum sp.]|uniref:hypothetical protein n=1 Tax=Albidovulum sp. TaxID=1872424 RepID=UPI003C8C045B